MRIASLAIPGNHPASARNDRGAVEWPLRRSDVAEPSGNPSRSAGSKPERLLPRSLADGDALQSIPARNRAAVSAYIANQPSAIERLGVELVGIDEFA